MLLSKHHYALELARKGNKVFFLNPPRQSGMRFAASVTPSDSQPDLFIVDHSLGFPYILKFRAKWLFDLLVKHHVRKLLRRLNLTPQIIWSFDIGNLYPLVCFPDEAYKIFHPVDEPNSEEAIKAAKGSDIIFSVTKEILEKYRSYPAPKHFIQHGISQDFLDASGKSATPGTSPARVGFSGNLLRPDIDRKVFLQIVKSHPQLSFECFGSFDERQSNIGGSASKSQVEFIRELRALPNVNLHGVLPAAMLPHAYADIDVWLICYDVKTDQSKGTNYHKIMEFLSTGKVIVSNNVSTYEKYPKLVTMVNSREHNRELPGLFSEVMNSLHKFNSEELKSYRREFAASNSYPKQVGRIEALIEQQ